MLRRQKTRTGRGYLRIFPFPVSTFSHSLSHQPQPRGSTVAKMCARFLKLILDPTVKKPREKSRATTEHYKKRNLIRHEFDYLVHDGNLHTQ